MLNPQDTSKVVALQLRSLNWLDRKLVMRKLPAEAKKMAQLHLNDLRKFSQQECLIMLDRLTSKTSENTLPIESQENPSNKDLSKHVSAILSQKVEVSNAVLELAKQAQLK